MEKQEFEHLKQEMDALLDRIQNAKVVKGQIEKISKDIEGMAREVDGLHQQLEKEKVDVVRLKKLSLTNFYHTLINDKTQLLEKEEQEVLAVKLKIDRLAAQRMAQQNALDKLKLKEVSLDGLEKQWKMMLEKKKSLIAHVDDVLWDKIRREEEGIEGEKLQLKEISEAISAGNSVLTDVTGIQKSLDSAAGWGTYDMLGGGLIATMAKRGHLDEAQKAMHHFQSSLRVFNRELEDVGGGIDFDLHIDGFLSFADWFFDGFFVDWVVQSKIHDAKSQMAVLEGRIRALINNLRQESTRCNTRIDGHTKAIEAMIQTA